MAARPCCVFGMMRGAKRKARPLEFAHLPRAGAELFGGAGHPGVRRVYEPPRRHRHHHTAPWYAR